MKPFKKWFSLLVVAFFLASVPMSAQDKNGKDSKDGKDKKEHRGNDDRSEGQHHGPSAITITSNGGGTVSGPTSVPWDEDAVYVIVPDPGSTFVLTVDGVVRGNFTAPLTFDLEDVKGPHTIDVFFFGVAI